MASREFELPEIRVLIDAVQSADFISPKKSKALLEKLGKYASKYQFSKIEKQVYIENRNKRNNESLFYTINELHDAIISKKQVWATSPSATTSKKRPAPSAGSF